MSKPFLSRTSLSGRTLAAGLLLSLLALSACNRNPLLVKRSPCPAIAIPAHVGSYTRFNPPQSRNADAIELTAQFTDVSGTCVEGAEFLSTDVSFVVTAQRRTAGPAKQVYLPVFIALAQGGNVLVSSRQAA